MSSRIAIYPGTFDPITNGHLDVVERARGLFDRVVIAVSTNPSKSPMFPLEERVALIKEAVSRFDGVEVDTFEGLVVAYADRIGGKAIVRGLRTAEDFGYEVQMSRMNAAMTGVETVFLTSSPEVSFISSTLVREIARFGGDVSSFVPEEVTRKMKERSSGEA